MPRPKPINYDPPLDLSRLPKTSTPTRGDKLKLLRDLENRAGSLIMLGTNRATFHAIERDVRAAHQRAATKDGASVRAEAPSRPEDRTEQGSSVAQACLERKIVTEHADFSIEPLTGAVELRTGDLGDPIILTADEARQLAALLIEAADDVDRDTAVREHNAKLLQAITE